MVSGLTTPPSCLRQATSPYTGEAILQGSRKYFSKKKIFGRRRCKRSKRGVCRQANTRKERPEWGPRKNRAASFVGFIFRVPENIFRRKRFLGEGATGIQSVQFGLAQTAAKGVVFRRGAADRSRTDTPFRYRILSPARLPIPPRRHMRRPEKDGAAFYQRRLIRLRKGRERRRRLRARSRRFVRKKQALLLRVLRFRPDRAHPSRCAP